MKDERRPLMVCPICEIAYAIHDEKECENMKIRKLFDLIKNMKGKGE